MSQLKSVTAPDGGQHQRFYSDLDFPMVWRTERPIRTMESYSKTLDPAPSLTYYLYPEETKQVARDIAESIGLKKEDTNDSGTPEVNSDDGYTDLTTPERRRHILDGDETGGGHRHGTGRPGKSQFP